MPLKNNSKEIVSVKYNGIERTVRPGEVLDTRDFNITAESAYAVETALIDKFGKGALVRVESAEKTLAKQLDDANAKIEELKAQVKGLERIIENYSRAQQAERVMAKKQKDDS